MNEKTATGGNPPKKPRPVEAKAEAKPPKRKPIHYIYRADGTFEIESGMLAQMFDMIREAAKVPKP